MVHMALMNSTNPHDVVAFYGSVPAAAAAGQVSRRAVYKWLKAGKVPENRAYRYEVISNGKLRVRRRKSN